ncbi:MAG: HD domain-containing protein [Nanoarchaeota archaeon]|nr:HD domain-containing protein [Nanoarchaeota archaeon]MBU1103240.1 HD domain-containing protein [Nanoarchaeota archaeon]
MKKVFSKILELARQYYEKGRIYDLPQIDWMIKKGEAIAKKEKMNRDLLLPVIILHDIGYSKVGEENPNVKDRTIKKEHMKKGATIAKKILKKVDYEPELSKAVVYYVSVHDNWIFGDNKPFTKCKEMALFNDLDFLVGIRNKRMFDLRAKSLKMSPEEMYNDLLKEEKLINRPFCCAETKKMFSSFLKARKKELKH